MNYRGLVGHVAGGDPQCGGPIGVVACNFTPTPIASFSDFSAPTVSQIACAKRGANGVYCWGDNGFGQLGLGTIDTSEHATPAPITVTSPARVAPGLNHTCAIDPSGQVACWGYNFWGEVGDGTIKGTSPACEGNVTYCVTKASHVLGLPKIVDLSAGMDLTLALDVDGSVWAWGANPEGNTGHPPGAVDGGPEDKSCYVSGVGGGPCTPLPTRVPGLP
jgi:alpha-tubulin suppressor-like RCC1 family protein